MTTAYYRVNGEKLDLAEMDERLGEYASVLFSNYEDVTSDDIAMLGLYGMPEEFTADPDEIIWSVRVQHVAWSAKEIMALVESTKESFYNKGMTFEICVTQTKFEDAVAVVILFWRKEQEV